MDLIFVLKAVHLVCAVGVVSSVLLQNRGSSMGSIFGGGGGGTFRARRGTEALLFNTTIACGLIYTFTAIAIAISDVRIS